MSDGNVAFEKGGGVLRIVLTYNSTPRLSICVLLTHLFSFKVDYTRKVAKIVQHIGNYGGFPPGSYTAP